MELFIRYAVGAAAEALQDANLRSPKSWEEETGVSMGVGIGGLGNIERHTLLVEEEVQNGFLPSSSQ